MLERVVGMRDVFLGLLLMRALVMGKLVLRLGVLICGRGNRGLDHGRYRGLGKRLCVRRRGCRRVMLIVMVVMIMLVIVMAVIVMIVVAMVVLGVGVRLVALMVVRLAGLGRVMVGIGVMLAVMRVLVIGECIRLRRLGIGDDRAADAVARAAAAGRAVARTAAAVAILVLFLGLAMGALIGLDQRLTVGDRDLVVVGMDFAEGEEAVAVAAIFDKGGLKRRLYPRNLGEVDIPAQLLALGGLEIKFFDAIAADHDDPGLFRVGGIDQHLVGHIGTLDGGGRVGPWAQEALSGDATVHLIRG
jgi:hypothetical protein